MVVEINAILTIFHIFMFILAILSIFIAVLLLKRLKDEDLAVSMIYFSMRNSS